MPGRQVWVVDDSPLDVERAGAVLRADYEVVTFSDGASLLEAIGSRPAPEVVVLDWIMPAISGIDVCRFLRSARSPAPTVSILLLTAKRETAHLVEGLSAGANDFLPKPYADEELRARVANLFRARDLLDRVGRAEEHVRRLLAASPDALLTTDDRGQVSYASEEAERVFASAAGGLIGRNLSDLLPGFDLSTVALHQESALIPLADVRINGELYAPTARRMPADISASLTVALRNVTERRVAEARRLDFYSVIAHDLRSPLNSILLRTDLLLRGQRGPLPALAIGDLRKVESNIRTLVALINDFLELAELEGTGYVGDREHVDLGALIRQCVEDIQPLIDESRLSLTFEFEHDDLSVVADRRRMMQVISNLLSNAVKFTPIDGSIRIALRSQGGQLEVRITDTGRGIEAHVLPTLFQRYARAIDPHHPVAGTGLGLMIVREIVEAHGGSVGVTSTPGTGSTFWFRIPRSHQVMVDAPDLQRVLIVDDDRDLRETLRFLLEAHGYGVVEAENGEVGLRALDEHDPCAIFADLTMPVMDGWEFVDRVRRSERHGALPICVLSAIVGHAPANASLVLEKPIPVEELLKFLRRFCPAPVRSAATSI